MSRTKNKYIPWTAQFHPPRQIDGVTTESEARIEDPNDEIIINYPVTATIVNVHYANSPTNRSLKNLENTQLNASVNTVIKEIVTGEETKETSNPTPDFSLVGSGNSVEYDILIDEGSFRASGISAELFRSNVPLASSFGGVKNYCSVVASPTTNKTVTANGGNHDGDRVLVDW